MPNSCCYQPEMGRDLVRRLHFAAKAERIPMTRYLRRLLDRELPPHPPPSTANSVRKSDS